MLLCSHAGESGGIRRSGSFEVGVVNMARATTVICNFYCDSVSLMQLSATLTKLSGVEQASASMATANIISLLKEAGLLAGTIEAGPNDLLIALQGDEVALDHAMTVAGAALNQASAPVAGTRGPRRMTPHSIEMGLEDVTPANLVLISTPGVYAAAEAFKTVRLGLKVMVFSDNESLQDEVALKRYARDHDLMVMGPDCGTAIINGIPLAFANVVRRGEIGVVAASGTGFQQVTGLIDRLGKGIARAIGTGGHDLHKEVGGITMLQGIAVLATDPATTVIVLIISKPPAPDVARRVLKEAEQAGKPVVVNFLGADLADIKGRNLYAVKTLEDAAVTAVALSDGRPPDSAAVNSTPASAMPPFSPTQRFVRGLYSVAHSAMRLHFFSPKHWGRSIRIRPGIPLCDPVLPGRCMSGWQCVAGAGQLEFYRQCRTHRSVGKRIARYRADRASSQAALINELEADQVRWAITADQDVAVKAVMAGLPPGAWEEPEQGCGCQVAETVHTMPATKAAFRLIIKREERPQGDLFEKATEP